MRYFLDTEFVDDGKTIDLISIGIVAEDGRTYYAQSAEFLEHGKPNEWVQKNVIPYLDNYWLERSAIKDDIAAFLNPEKYGKPEIWGWCSGYDWVALCQIFGTMMDLPSGWPHYIRDIQYVLDERGITDDQLPADNHEQLPADNYDGQVHNALVDARYICQLWSFLHEE